MNDLYGQFHDKVVSEGYVEELNKRKAFLRFGRYLIPVKIHSTTCFQDPQRLRVLINFLASSDAEDCKALVQLTNEYEENDGGLLEIGKDAFECQDVLVRPKLYGEDNKVQWFRDEYWICMQVRISFSKIMHRGLVCAYGDFVIGGHDDAEPFKRWELMEYD